MQNTIGTEKQIVGTGLHSGKPVRLRLRPAAADTGLVFRRVDMPKRQQMIQVCPENWVEANLCTVLQNSDGIRVSTVEHLLAALHGCGIHNAVIEIDGAEVPILDGSADPFVRVILDAGIKPLHAPLLALRVLRPVTVTKGDASARLLPSDRLEIDFQIDFADPAIGYQHKHLNMRNGTFLREVSDCRTFCMRKDVETMQEHGLALGGTLENAVVFHEGDVLSPGGLRRSDEPVRHKILDAMGDLYVAGYPLIGRYEAIRAGHALTGRVLQALFSDPANYEFVECDSTVCATLPGLGLSIDDLRLSA
ncbi:MAG: UDP-3-O-acyl-N-acetylglucosamine deacetylase [Roseinatronobacter sp.]|jgi:UDP-3-O-[3-hydroxymyristoyl] N-acetylglucosamine deacetylase|nr:MAG: UDP-3-O-acyl-N-acetylglucosamine deacetylase [Roseinatronobacter sp.]